MHNLNTIYVPFHLFTPEKPTTAKGNPGLPAEEQTEGSHGAVEEGYGDDESRLGPDGSK